jgi:ATP-dependent Clp protease ATP-binding subunit ClpA
MTPPPGLQDLIDTVRQDAPSDGALDQLVTASAAVAQLEDTSDALLGYFVDRCRREGRSWSEISGALGVTKQAVHKRFATTMADQVIAAIPAPTLERFTARARSTLSAADRAAKSAGQHQIGSAHLLLGLYAEPDGLGAKALLAMNVSQEAVVAAVQAGAGGSAAGASAQAEAGTNAQAEDQTGKRFTADGRRALRDALAFALERAHNYIGTEHLLIGLYGDPAAPAARILTEAGTGELEARAIVTDLLSGFTSSQGTHDHPERDS